MDAWFGNGWIVPGLAALLFSLSCDGGAGACDTATPTRPGDCDVYTLNVDIATGVGSGNVRSTPAGIDCTIDDGVLEPQGCSAEFLEIDLVSLFPSTHDFTDFDGWTGDCEGVDVCVLTMNQDRSVTALMPRRALIGIHGENELTFAASEGTNPAPQSKGITNVGEKVLNWQASFNQTWISVTPTSGTLEPDESANLTVTVDSDELAAGTYEAVISIVEAGGGHIPRSIDVTLIVT